MGCQESTACLNNELVGRAKAAILKKTHRRMQRTATKNNVEPLEEGCYQMTDKDWDMVEDILLNHQLLFKARGYANKEIMNRLENFQAAPKQIIFRKGDPSNYFYIIIYGTI